MSLTEADILFRDSAWVRKRNRVIIAVIVGLFANWLWLFILIGLQILGDFSTMYKVLSHSFLTNQKLEQSTEERWTRLGQSLMAACSAGVLTVLLACTVKVISNWVWDYSISLFG